MYNLGVIDEEIWANIEKCINQIYDIDQYLNNGHDNNTSDHQLLLLSTRKTSNQGGILTQYSKNEARYFLAHCPNNMVEYFWFSATANDLHKIKGFFAEKKLFTEVPEALKALPTPKIPATTG